MSQLKSKIEVSTLGQSLYVSGDDGLFDLPLTAYRVRYDPERGLVRQPENMLKPADRLPNLGLYPIIMQLASERGIEFDGRLNARSVDESSFANQRPALTAFLRGNKTGVISSRHSNAIPKVIAWTMQAFPNASVTVIGSKYLSLIHI